MDMFKPLLKLFAAILPSLKSAMPILLFLLFILMNIAIWMMGPWLKYEDTFPIASVFARSLVSFIFSLICFAIWGVVQWRRLKVFHQEKELERSYQEDPIQLYEERQETELNKVMLNMKENLNKRNYLYALPWYLVLGLENAGKTSLINRSGQKFVFSSVMRASGKKSENPYSFDWWIGSDSVLIDPDGELLTQRMDEEGNDGEMERRLWHNFVHWLDKTRSRRPLNGVVLALDIAHLATATASERSAYASLLRARLRELMETLSTRLPVYITFTKLDLLHGFEPFFREYTRAQSEDVLGFTFSMESVNQLDNWIEEFETEFAGFVGRINDSISPIMQGLPDGDDKVAIYSFARQMAGMQDVLKQFFVDALGSDQFSTAPLVRGTFFTSVFQQGVPTNAFVDAASRRYGLTHSINSAQNAVNSTTYFTQKLFTKIIYPEAGLASDNFRVARQKRRILWLSFLICAISSGLLAVSWHQFYEKNIEQTNAVLKKVNNYKEKYASDSMIRSEQDILSALNDIRDATLEFGFFREKPLYISDMGLYQGHLIGPKVEETYLSLLQNRFLPELMDQVAKDLSGAKNDVNKLAALRVYKMMTDKNGRRDGFVEEYFAKGWQKEYSGDRETQETLLQHLDYAMRHIDLEELRDDGDKYAEKVLTKHQPLISKIQSDLGTMPVEERVYRNLKQNASTELGSPLNVKHAIGPVFDIVFQERVINTENLLVSQLLTSKGFEKYFLPQSESVAELALIDSWVLGQSEVAEFSTADKQVLREKIREQYVSDYTNTWRAAINAIDIKYFSDINDAVQVLDNLTGSMEPFSRMLVAIEDNTKLFPELPENDAERIDLMKAPKYQVAAAVNSPFAELNSLLDEREGQPAYMEEVMEAVAQLQTYLTAIQNAPDMGKAALDATKDRLTLKNADPIYTVQRIASGLPKPLDTMVGKLATESWYVVKQEAVKHLEVRWFKDVYSKFDSKFANRYPFDPASKKDVSLQDFEDFFAPEGTLNQFYDNQLKMFMDENLGLSANSGEQSLIRKDVLEQLEEAKVIQQAFFQNKGILDVKFSLEPVELSSNKRRSVINVDGQYVGYSHGPKKTVELVWPNTLREGTSSKLTFVPTKVNASPRSIAIQGAWAFFRLLEKGEVVGASATSVDYRFNLSGGYAVYRLHSDADSNPFTSSLFKSFKLSKTLY